ncbi:heat shock 70 kDa protein 12A-like [Crassostrea virginica]
MPCQIYVTTLLPLRVLQYHKNIASNKLVHVPVTFIEEFNETLAKDLTTLPNESRFNNHFYWKSDKVRIDMPTFEGFFQPACIGIINHVKELFKSPKVKDVKKKNPYAIRKAFPDCQVIVPQEAGLAVLRGAVVFGYNPKAIDSRIAKYTYGVKTNEEFDTEKHMESKMVWNIVRIF